MVLRDPPAMHMLAAEVADTLYRCASFGRVAEVASLKGFAHRCCCTYNNYQGCIIPSTMRMLCANFVDNIARIELTCTGEELCARRTLTPTAVSCFFSSL
jgi:hypothetical protein